MGKGSKYIKPLTEDESLGWVLENKVIGGEIVATYLHGIFENGNWRRNWLNRIRKKKGLHLLPITQKDHTKHREELIEKMMGVTKKGLNIFV